MKAHVRRTLGWTPAAASLILLILSGAAQRAAAQSGDGVPSAECCLRLLNTVGARAMALGNAITARSEPGAIFVNPALLAGVTDDEFLVHTTTTSLDKSNTFTLLITSEVAGNFALSYRLFDEGELDATDGSGNITGTLSIIDYVLTASYGTHVTGGVTAGVSYELYQFRQTCQGFCAEANQVSTTHAIDLGVQYSPARVPALEAGISLVHLGFALQTINAEQADPTPSRVRVGAAYEVLHHFQPDTTVLLHLSADLVDRWRRPGDAKLDVGAELSLQNAVFLRAGYGGGTGITSGFAVGVGLHFDRFDAGVAKAFIATAVDDTEPYEITFGIRF